MTQTLKLLKHNGWVTTWSRQGNNIYLKATKRMKVARFKEELTAEELVRIV